MGTLLQDLRYSARMLFKHRGFTLVAITTLALGIGANATIFSLVNAFLLRPLPVKDPQELVVLLANDRHIPLPHVISIPDFEDYRREEKIFSDLALVFPSPVSFSTTGQAERRWVLVVSGNYFKMLGVEPALGRMFLSEEDATPGTHPVVVLGYGCWQKQFAGDLAVIGKTVNLNGQPFTVIGVAPEKMSRINWATWDAFVPAMMGESIWPEWKMMATNRDVHSVLAMGRLQNGVGIAKANELIGARSHQMQQSFPQTNRGVSVTVVPESQARPEASLSSFLPPIAAFVLALVALVMGVACTNVAGLMLTRATARQKELALRAAMGASRFRLVRLLFAESLLLAVAGGAFGVIVALWITDWFAALKPGGDIPIQFNFNLDWRVFVYTAAATLLAGLLTGLPQAINASRPNLNEALKEGKVGRPARHRLRNLMVVMQVAVSMLLLVCAGLFIRSARQAGRIDLGFRNHDLLLATVEPGVNAEQKNQIYERLVERVRSLPGVREAGLSSFVPFGGGQGGSAFVTIDERPADESLLTGKFIVTPGYFRTMDIPLLSGRDFATSDNKNATRVAVINQAMADQLWPGQPAIGKHFRLSRTGAPVEVVGMIRTHKYAFLGEAPRPTLYLPLAQQDQSSMTLHLQTSVDPASLAAAVQAIVREVDSSAGIHDIRTIEEHLNRSVVLGPLVIGVAMVSAFGILALILAVMGLYGLISFAVAERTHEIGIRIALGAQPRDVVRLIVRQGMRPALAGIVIGLLLALGATRLMASLLFDISPTDPPTFLIISSLLIVIMALACWVPARRAARVDPIKALRCE